MAEWYDWYIYTFLAPIFATQIFPGSKQLAQSLSAFAIFATAAFSARSAAW